MKFSSMKFSFMKFSFSNFLDGDDVNGVLALNFFGYLLVIMKRKFANEQKEVVDQADNARL